MKTMKKLKPLSSLQRNSQKAFSILSVPEALQPKYDFKFHQIAVGSTEQVNLLTKKVLPLFPKNFQFIQTVHLLEISYHRQPSHVLSDIIHNLEKLSSEIDFQGYLLLISVAESIQFWNAKLLPKTPILQKDQKILEEIIYQNSSRFLNSDIEFVYKNRIATSLGIKLQEQLDCQLLMNSLNSFIQPYEESYNSDAAFCELISFLNVYFLMSLTDQQLMRDQLRKLISNKLIFLTRFGLLKFLTFVDFENELFDDQIKLVVESRIYYMFNDQTEYEGLLCLIHFLSCNPLVFRQKLIIGLNEEVKKREELPEQSLIEILYLNDVNNVNNEEFQDQLKTLTQFRPNHNFDFLFKVQYLVLKDLITNPVILESFNKIWKSFEFENLIDSELIRAYMVSFHLQNNVSLQLIKTKIQKRKSIELSAIKPVILESVYLLESNKKNKNQINEAFGFIFEMFVQELIKSESLEKSEKVFWRDLLSQICDQFDERLELI